MKLVYTDKFKQDLLSIVRFIAQDSKANAHRFAAELRGALESLPPNVYQCRQSIYFSDTEIRDCIYKGYVIPYKIFSDKIVFLGVTKHRLTF